jgi:hypothetical protein
MLKYKQHLAYSSYDSNKKIKKTWIFNTFEFISFIHSSAQSIGITNQYKILSRSLLSAQHSFS